MAEGIHLRLKELRKMHGYTQAEVAKLIGLGHQTILNHERGIREANYETLLKYAELYHCSIDNLLGVREAFSPYIMRLIETAIMLPESQQIQLSQYADFLRGQQEIKE